MRHPPVRWSVVPIATGFLAIAACGKQAIVEEAAAAASGDPCALLTTAEVASVIPGAKSPKRDTSREQYGISGCAWQTPQGRFGIEYWKSEPSSVANEARGLAQGFLDPLKPAAKSNVRFEKVDGVGEDAVAIVEIGDAKRGILHDVAMLVTQRGDRKVVLGSDDLARVDRAAALAGLKKLGTAAAKRL